MRRFLPLLLIPFLSASAGEQKSSPLTVRLHAEGSPSDGETFGTKIQLTNPAREITIGKVPIVTERDFVAFFPFPASDGSFGAYFRLDANGTNKLESHTTEFRDKMVVALIDGRVASAMLVDKKITDGLMIVPNGFAPREIALLQTKYPIIGKEKEFSTQKKKALDALAEQKKMEKAMAPKPTPKPTPTPKENYKYKKP